MDFNYLIVFYFSAISTDRRQVTPRLILTNVMALNYLVWPEIFVSEDQQLRAVHLILEFDPILKIFQEVGHAIRAGDPQINLVNVSKPDFLARDDLPPTILPVHQIPPPLAIPLQQVPLEATAAAEEEIGSSHLSLEEEIDQFRFEEEEKAPEKPMELSDSETKYDRLSSTHLPKLVIAQIDSSSEEMEEKDLKKRFSLKGLTANRNKRGTSKDVPKIQTPTILPPPPTTDLGLLANPNLKKKRSGQELEKGEMTL